MLLRRYRALGADPPFGDPLRAHGVAMEGAFWRLVDPRSGRVVVALCGIHRAADGRTWANVALAGHPGDVVHARDVPTGAAEGGGFGMRAGDGAFDAGPRHVRADLGPGARLDLRLDTPRTWPRRRPYGGLGSGHAVPGLSQYWHPHVLGGRASGTATLAGEDVDLDGFEVYAEKNWGRVGFPADWWWGQAGAFPGVDACVAFAGGEVRLGPVRATASAIVVRVGDRVVRLGDPVLSRARTELVDGRWRLRARGALWEAEIDARADTADAHVLPVPDPARERCAPGAVQHFAGELHVVLRRRGRTVLDAVSPLAGLERGGAASLARELERRARDAEPPGTEPPARVPAGR